MHELIRVGQRFGSWEVMEDQINPYTARLMCKCVCGTKRKVLVRGLANGATKSCGCVNRAQAAATMRARYDAVDPIVVGAKYGRLTVVDATERMAVVCQCDCGKTATVQYHNLKVGNTRSCGCLRTEQLLATVEDRLLVSGMKLSGHTLYNTWKRLKGQSTDPAHPNWELFGGAGITLYEPWLDLLTFITDVEAEIGPRPVNGILHRIDTTKPFEPGNLKWGSRDALYNPRGRARRAMSDEDRRKAVSMVLDDGMKQYDVAEHFKVGPTHISHLVRLYRDGKL